MEGLPEVAPERTQACKRCILACYLYARPVFDFVHAPTLGNEICLTHYIIALGHD